MDLYLVSHSRQSRISGKAMLTRRCATGEVQYPVLPVEAGGVMRSGRRLIGREERGEWTGLEAGVKWCASSSL